jgi:hypothetical protein
MTQIDPALTLLITRTGHLNRRKQTLDPCWCDATSLARLCKILTVWLKFRMCWVVLNAIAAAQCATVSGYVADSLMKLLPFSHRNNDDGCQIVCTGIPVRARVAARTIYNVLKKVVRTGIAFIQVIIVIITSPKSVLFTGRNTL